jgi:hypothetical protein
MVIIKRGYEENKTRIRMGNCLFIKLIRKLEIIEKIKVKNHRNILNYTKKSSKIIVIKIKQISSH